MLLAFQLLAAQPATTKEALIKVGPVWLKVSVQVPAELVATREYEIPVTIVITEVEGDLKVFYLKGLRFTIDTGSIEYVPDTPISLTLGRVATLTAKLAPRFFAAQMAPGDVKDTSLRIDLSYYYEATAKTGEGMSDSGYYSAFASIPLRVITPRTYVYVEPSMNTTYEPNYIIRFFVDVWVDGEGFIENARATVTGAPVQCYLLTTGRMEAGERRTLTFSMNLTKLGPIARNQYNLQLEVTADTPWGYMYKYTYPITLSIKPIREVSVSAPSLAVANALTPIKVTLNPPPESGEQLSLSVYWGSRVIYTGSYSQTVYVALPEGEGTVTVKVESNKYATSTGRTSVKTTTAEQSVSAYMSGSVLYFQVAPVYQNARVDVRVTDADGNTALSTSLPATSLSYQPTNLGGATAVMGTGTLPLDLQPGSYTILVTYNTGTASKSTTVSYQVPGAQPASGLPIPLPVIIVIVIAVVVVAVVLLIRRIRGR